MVLTDIRECGAHNILTWAIQKNADIKADVPLQSVINDELFYLLTLDKINFLELFRLTQQFRDKLRILEVKTAEIPSDEELKWAFPGTVQLGEDGEEMELSNLAKHSATAFYNVALQMDTDNDIIQENTSPMYLPMLSRQFRVQIPISFVDFISFMSQDECQALFNEDYPRTLEDIPENVTHGVMINVSMMFVKLTSMIQYDDRYNKYVKVIRHNPLRHYKGDDLFKVAMLGFSKYDRILRGETRVTMFQFNGEEYPTMLRRISRINAPLKLEVAIQLPIHYMEALCNAFSEQDLPIYCQSSIQDILDGGMPFTNFRTPDEDNPDAEQLMNGIQQYRTRIIEANQITTTAINLAVNADADVNITSAFALLPSLYTTKAVITVDTSKLSMFTGNSNLVISEMFKAIAKLADIVNNDLNEGNK